MKAARPLGTPATDVLPSSAARRPDSVAAPAAISCPPGVLPADSNLPDVADSSCILPEEADPTDPGPLLRLVGRQEIAFAVVGGINTALGMALTVMWLAVLGERAPAAAAPAAAYALSVVVAFALHRGLVFRVRGRVLRDFAAFVAVNAGGLVANMVLLQVAVSVLHLPRIPAALGVMALVAGASFFGHRHISFRRPTRPAADVSRPGAVGG